MGTNDKKKTRYQGMKEGIEDNPLVSIMMLVIVMFVGLGAVAGAYNNIRAVLPTRVPQTSTEAPANTAPVVNPQPTATQPPPANTATATPAPAANAPLTPTLAGDWIGQTSNGATLHIKLKADPQAGGDITLQATIPLGQGCSQASDRFQEKTTLTFDPGLNRILAQSDKILLSADVGGNPQNPTLSGQLTVFVKDFSGKPACTQVAMNWSAQKIR